MHSVLSVGGASFLSGDSRSQRSQQLIGRLAIVRRDQILSLRDPVRSQHFLTQLAEPAARTAILTLGARALARDLRSR